MSQVSSKRQKIALHSQALNRQNRKAFSLPSGYLASSNPDSRLFRKVKKGKIVLLASFLSPVGYRNPSKSRVSVSSCMWKGWIALSSDCYTPGWLHLEETDPYSCCIKGNQQKNINSRNCFSFISRIDWWFLYTNSKSLPRIISRIAVKQNASSGAPPIDKGYYYGNQ